MGNLSYCDWCQDQILKNNSFRMEYKENERDFYGSHGYICKVCNKALNAFVKSMKRDRKPKVCYKE